MKIGYLILLTFIYVLFPLKALAHVKWFTEEHYPAKIPIEQIISPLFIVLSLSIVVILGILVHFSPRFMECSLAQRIDLRLADSKKYTFSFLRVGVSCALIIQMLNSSILAPEIPLTRMTMGVAILTASLLVIPNKITTKLSAIGLFVLFLIGMQNIGWFNMLYYVFYLSIVFTFLVHNTKYQNLGLPALYLGTGISLIWAAAEKWVLPGLCMNIISNYHMPTLGFDAHTFIVLSAFIEFILGYLLVVGMLNRLFSLIITGLFILTTTVFGSVEIVGHFIVHIILIIFIIEGKGFYKPPIEIHKRLIEKVVFVALNFVFINSTILLLYYRFA